MPNNHTTRLFVTAGDFLHHENPPTRAGVQPATLGTDGQRQTNYATQSALAELGIFCSAKKALIDRAVWQEAPSCIKMYGSPSGNHSSSCGINDQVILQDIFVLVLPYHTFNHVQTYSTLAADD
ncbi:hypothetical protein TNCV_3403481 [Trichonephila clavipes]|nr:hypothetical protein TNCV_3403481 [Trichonephila clavipes]